MKEEEHNRLYVIKRVKKIKKGGHHGGSWKIAYADFVTAMMTFFLLMWLLAMMNKYQLEGIAEYFKKPLTDAFKHQGLQVNRDAQKDKSVAQGIDSEKAKKEDEHQHKKFDEMSKSSKEISRATSPLSDVTSIGIQMENMRPGEKVFGMQDSLKNTLGSQASQAEILSIANRDQQEKTILQMAQASNLQSGQLMNKKGLSEKDIKEKDIKEVKRQMEENLENDPIMRQYKNQLNFIITADGLKIELHDLKDKPMFSTGKTDFEKYATTIVSWLAQQLNGYSNRVEIIGHTDAAQYQRNEYTNWELSADRANATRRELIKNGMKQEKIVRIIGVGDADLLDTKNGLNPANRRIEIIVMTDEAVKRMTR